MTATAAAAEFRASYRDHLHARLSEQCVGVGVAVVGNDDAGLQRDHVVAVVPLFPFCLKGVATGRDGPKAAEPKRFLHDCEERLFIAPNLEMALVVERVDAEAPYLIDHF